jgi:hypothetical protein
MKCYIDNCVHLRSCIRDINIELYPFLTVSKMPETSRRVSHLVTKTYIFLREESEQCNTPIGNIKAEALTEYKKANETDGEYKKVPLDPRVPDRSMCIATETGQQEQAKLLAFLDKDNNVFAWSTSHLVGVSRDIIEHRLHVNPSAKPKNRSSGKCQKRKSKQ